MRITTAPPGGRKKVSSIFRIGDVRWVRPWRGPDASALIDNLVASGAKLASEDEDDLDPKRQTSNTASRDA